MTPGPKPRSAVERFEELVFADPNSGCFIFAGGTFSKGYGKFSLGSMLNNSRRHVQAHRFAWEAARGPVPAGLCVLHKCDIPCCVNPDHLFLGTVQDNNSDIARKGRGRKSPKGLPFGAKPHEGGFSARVCFHGKAHYLGSFSTASEASAVALRTKHQLLKGEPMNPVGPNQVPRPACLSKGDVPSPSPAPPAAKEGINSLTSSTKG